MNAIVKLIDRRVARIAAELGVSVEEVLAALDSHPIAVDRDTYLKRSLALELLKLDELEESFRTAALNGDVPSGIRGNEDCRTQKYTFRFRPPVMRSR